MVVNLKKIIPKFEALRLIEFSKYKKLNGEAAIYRKFNLKYSFATKIYPQQIMETMPYEKKWIIMYDNTFNTKLQS